MTRNGREWALLLERAIELPVEVQRCCIDLAIIVRAASGLE